MKLVYIEVLKRTINIKSYSPAAFSRLMEQFENMSLGGTGGIFFLGHKHSTVREQYYKDWKDQDFVKLLSEIKESIDG